MSYVNTKETIYYSKHQSNFGQKITKRFLVLRCDHCKEFFDRSYAKRFIDKKHHFCSYDCRNKSEKFSNLVRDSRNIFLSSNGAEYSKKMSKIVSDIWACRTPAECEKIFQAVQKTNIEYWDSLTENERTEFSEKVKNGLSQMSAQKKAKRIKKAGETLKNKSPEEKQASRDKAMHTLHKNGYGKKNVRVYSKKRAEFMNCRSSYEKKAIEKMDNDEDILYYEYEPVTIPYVFDKEDHSYYPDFLVEHRFDGSKIIEVKPKNLVEHEVNIAKFEAARLYCEEYDLLYEIWTEEELGI